MGFRLTSAGLSPLHSNVDAVQRLPMPSCSAQLASFLGMTAYYLRFLSQYSATTAPLWAVLSTKEQNGPLLLLHKPSVQRNRSTPLARRRPWPVSGHVSGGTYICMAVHSHCEQTTKLSRLCLRHLEQATGHSVSIAGLRGSTNTTDPAAPLPTRDNSVTPRASTGL